MIRDMASMLHVGENQQLITIGERTLERYVANYRKGGLEALKPQVRPEKNSLKAFPQEVLDEAIKLRLAKPQLSHVGSGKSTTLRATMHNLDASRYRFIYLAHSELTPGEFYKNLLYQINVQPQRGISENKRLVSQSMLEWNQKGVKPVVVIDEAQELSVRMLGELRFVLNYQADSYSPLTILLIGQPQLTKFYPCY
ncbi:AAA family ATPase [Desulfotomaculum sp. 1211_IL3151]|uniref:AAA family ATPase n=1 Tax=Desulfotomaculum sp. 1211_IL3151 TaxID=3084055 RepID=UPI002FD8F481